MRTHRRVFISEAITLDSTQAKGAPLKGKRVAILATDGFDALMLPGGVMNPDQLRLVPSAVTFVRSFFEADKPVAAICHAPMMLIESNVVRDRQLTS